MIGLQYLIIERNIKVYDLAKELECSYSNIYDWFKNNRVPDSRLEILAKKFNVEKEYLNKIINNVNTYKPRNKGLVKNRYKIADDYAIIYLDRKNGDSLETYIDLEDLEKVITFKYKWCPDYKKKIDNYYAVATVYLGIIDGKPKYNSVFLHKFIMGNPDCMVDHIDAKKTLDNRKSNLRMTVNEFNSRNRKGKNKNNKSGYRNVCWNKDKGQWVVQLQINGKNTILDSFDNVDEAGAYAEIMRLKYYGEFAGGS